MPVLTIDIEIRGRLSIFLACSSSSLRETFVAKWRIGNISKSMFYSSPFIYTEYATSPARYRRVIMHRPSKVQRTALCTNVASINNFGNFAQNSLSHGYRYARYRVCTFFITMQTKRADSSLEVFPKTTRLYFER